MCLILNLGPAAGAGVVVIGGLSNFDCPNNTPTPEDEFQIEFPSLDPAKISGYWANATYYKGSGYGAPTQSIGQSSDGIAGHTSVYVDYKKTGIVTPVNFTEHFGVHFYDPTFQPASTIYTWKRSGIPYNFNLPTMTLTSTSNGSGGTNVLPVVVNTTPNPVMVQLQTGERLTGTPVQLGDLVDTNPEIQTVEAEPEAGSNGAGGVILRPGEVLGVDGEAHDPLDAIVLNPQAWLAAHPLEPHLDINLNNPGDALLTRMAVFDVGAGNTQGALIANVFSAANSVATPEPASLSILLVGAVGLLRRRRRTNGANFSHVYC